MWCIYRSLGIGKPHLGNVPRRTSAGCLVGTLLEMSSSERGLRRRSRRRPRLRRIYICKTVDNESPVAFLFHAASFSAALLPPALPLHRKRKHA
ncbi:hypothetical protein CesoFtcFv8_007895 [Champsocephalus esox]|uniref:Uncharacterized protein n=1 Tax=Champsocephalus esox TaxID=159716 RepID=A0AAN8H4S9_9TELE|nr:hypothetical protein CesoFtcFv8_007895 [Champsocephalus esox]